MTIFRPDLSSDCAGIKSPNPFWLASGPPTNTLHQARNAFAAGWGGVVWKTVTSSEIVNVSSRYGSHDLDGVRMAGFNNIELISDRPLEENFAEIAIAKREWPDRAMIVSVMCESRREAWHEVIKRSQDTGADGLELNFGCPHGMSERSMGSAVGQVPEYVEMITAWVKEVATIPVLVKLTPNTGDIAGAGRAAARGGADGISLINTINSIVGVDLDTLSPKPAVRGRGSHGGYCGPAVKPIALNMVHAVASDPDIRLPVSGIGGVSAWQDAVEFMLLGSSNVQVCTAVMKHGFKLIDTLVSGLENWMRDKRYARLEDFIGVSVPNVGEWSDLDLGYKSVATINQDACIHCGLCYAACEDGAHQAIDIRKIAEADYVARLNGQAAARGAMVSGGVRAMPGLGGGYVNEFRVNEEACVGCNLCSFVCPVTGCITMVERPSPLPSMTWREYQRRLAAGTIEKIPAPKH